ncbi:glycine/D-amino acid oxidase-like deaminating enzyme [Bacillus oleivorans]|uniref:Glycine/D-amino acid oxidase-like deaminating enzyme n=1 Tax=Bacillus oleivorans TaxID=1448271 RepID=A0A285D6U1_9BACI|nr:FAD-dependent oxidoreductase [Bacillus oleivorans]SNX74968.1 glycine/D-amino acid oxidase-like deaminating enzyme [Bacillus oleivorans]
MRTADIVIIGGGVIGASIAYRLADRSRKVILVEKGGIGEQTSGSCDKGIYLQSKKPGIHLELARASRQIYENLEEELGIPIEFRKGGGMIVIESEKHLEFMKNFSDRQRKAGIDIRFLDRNESLKRQPCLSPAIVGSTYSPEDAEVNPLLLSQAFTRAAKEKGAEIRTHTEVKTIDQQHGKIVGIQTTKDYISTELVVNAAGPYAPAIGKMVGVEIPIKPRRGVILISEKAEPIVNGNILCAQYIAAKYLSQSNLEEVPPYGIGLSLGQTESGNLLIGGSREFQGFNKAVDPKVLSAIARHAIGIVPSIKKLRIIRSMAGFRPYTEDGLPIIDFAPAIKGFLIAAGHEGDGIALAPITGILVADLLEKKRRYEVFLEKLTLSRFLTKGG